jgi:hypothetical protein
MTPAPDLDAERRATRRELVAASRALHEHSARRVAVTRPITREDTVRVLSTVVQHTLPCALDELRAERDRLARDLASARVQLRTARTTYSIFRCNVWQIAQRALAGHEMHGVALEEVISEAMDSEDDRLWEEYGWVE